MKKIITILTVTLTLGLPVFAQLGTPLSQFSGNQMAFNPAYAGIYEMLAVNLSVRKSWIGVPGSPSIINFNGHAPFQHEKHAWGWVFQREQWGPLTGNLFYGNYAYKVRLDNEHTLSLGLQAGFLNHVVDWLKIGYVENETDPGYGPSYGATRSASTKIDANVGAFYLAPRWYVGVSAMHLTNPKYDRVTINGIDWYSQMRMQYFLMAGYHYDFGNLFSIRPEIFMRYVQTTPLSLNIGTHLYYTNRYSFGVNLMTGQKAVSFCAKAMLTDDLRVGLSYDVYYGSLKPYQKGSLEIMVNYNIRSIWWNWDKDDKKQNTDDLLWYN